MREPILKVVANPPQLFWAPFFLAIINMCLQVAIFSMVMSIVVVNPLLLLITILGGHIIISVISKRDIHIASILQSTGPFLKKSKNIYKVRGNKFGP
ncbi:MAG: hypothetical protein GY804_12210 [Alphaproteobacteria bacterium]|nr:hypothetical protein [Alphaproteobacteria bacterium]